MHLMVLYDIRADSVRRRIADACLDFGLQRIQYSAYLGRIDPDWRDELETRLQATIGDAVGRIHVVALPRDVVRKIRKLGPGIE